MSYPQNRFLPVLILILAVTLTGCLKSTVVTGLSEQEAQEIIVLLKDHGLSAERQLVAREREAATWTVSVKGGSQNLVLAWRVLQENGLPRPKVKGLDEVFANPGLIPTAGEEKARLLVGLSGEMSRTLNSVQGVVDARVHVVLPENSPLIDRAQWRPPSASVLIKYQGAQLPLKEEEIRSLVAKGVEGLTTENIAVVFKKIEPRPAPAYDVGWYLGNQEILVAALALVGIEALCILLLLFRLGGQKKKNRKLEEMAANSAQPRVAAGAVAGS